MFILCPRLSIWFECRFFGTLPSSMFRRFSPASAHPKPRKKQRTRPTGFTPSAKVLLLGGRCAKEAPHDSPQVHPAEISLGLEHRAVERNEFYNITTLTFALSFSTRLSLTIGSQKMRQGYTYHSAVIDSSIGYSQSYFLQI